MFKTSLFEFDSDFDVDYDSDSDPDVCFCFSFICNVRFMIVRIACFDLFKF